MRKFNKLLSKEMGKVSVNISLVSRSKRFNPLESQDDSPQGEWDIPKIQVVTPRKKERDLKKCVRGFLKCAYHLRG